MYPKSTESRNSPATNKALDSETDAKVKGLNSRMRRWKGLRFSKPKFAQY